MGFTGAAHRWVARHGTDCVQVDSQKQGIQTKACAGISRFTAGMATTDYNYIEIHSHVPTAAIPLDPIKSNPIEPNPTQANADQN
jgi:hypothetical protein